MVGKQESRGPGKSSGLPREGAERRSLFRHLASGFCGFSLTLVSTFSIEFGTRSFALPSASPSKVETPDREERALETRLWLSDEKDLPRIENEIVRLIQKRPNSVFAHHLMAQVKMREFAVDPQDLYALKQASDLAQQAVDLDIRNPVGYVAMANVLDLMGASDRGIDLLNKAEGAGLPSNWRFYFAKARLLSSEADTSLALTHLDKALAMRDVESGIVVPYVVALLQSEFTGPELVDQLKSWTRRFPSPTFDLAIAIALADSGDSVAAHRMYQNLLKGDPNNLEARLNDAILLYRDLHQERLAVSLFLKILEEGSMRLEPGLRSTLLTHLGAAHARSRDWIKAQNAFVEALKVSPQNLATLDIVTRSYREAKVPQKFVAFLRSARDVTPGISVMHAILGETLSEHLNEHDAAVDAFTDAITLDPDRGDYYNGLGLTYYRAKNYPQALKLFSAAMRLDPKDAVAKYNEACVLSILGRRDEAIESLADAVSLDPQLLETAKNDTDFVNIRTVPRFREITDNGGFMVPGLELGH